MCREQFITMFAKEHKRFLLFLLEATPKQVRFILQHLSQAQTAALQETAYNLLRGSIDLSEKQIQTLRKHRRVYRMLARKTKVKLPYKAIILLLETARQIIEQL